MTQAQYARHRKAAGLPGGTAKSVTIAVQEGRISLINGLIDPAVADIQWANNTRARASLHAAPAPAAPAPVQASAPPDAEASAGDPPAEAPSKPADPAGADYFQARSQKAQLELEEKAIDLGERRRELYRVDAIKAILAGGYVSMREGLMQLPSRMAAKLAAETDPAKVQSILEDAIYTALNHVAQLPDRFTQAETADET